jgi:uncharacterized repeat protein (TIGR02543 family)
MDLKLSTKRSKLIILGLFFLVFLGAGGYLLWRVNQPETVAPEDSEAGEGKLCDCGTDKKYCSTCSDWQDCLDEFGCCDCHGWKSSGSCYNCNQYAICGSLDGKNFAYTVTSWPSLSFCGDGVYGGTPSPSSPAFPQPGKTTTWKCVGAARTVNCSASRKALPTYTVTYKAGDNGSLTGTKVQTVSKGGSTTQVTAVPDTGYYFGGWSDGKSTNPRKDTNVTGDITVTATFSLSCGNGTCEADETAQSCPADCDANCGDGYCSHEETAANCPADCDPVCGDGQCTHDETSANCPEDCGPATSGGVPSTGIFDDTKTAMTSGFLLIFLGFTWRFFGRGVYLSVEFLGKVPRKISIQMKDLKADIRAKRRIKEMKVADKRKKNFERKVVKD